MFTTNSTVTTDSPAKNATITLTSLRTLIVGVIAVLLSLAVVAPASASPTTSPDKALASSTSMTPTARTYGCVSNYEWNHFYIGNRKNVVERFFGTRGWTAWSDGYVGVKKYYACGPYYSVVKVKYVWTGSRWVVKNAYRYYR